MHLSARFAGPAVVFVFACMAGASAANPKQINDSIVKGAAFLKAQYAKGGLNPNDQAGNYGIGPACLAGLALLESGTPVDDAAVKNITALVRKQAYEESQTYQTALCLMYLDRLGDPADVPAIQMLAVRLLSGQTAGGGWSYATCAAVPAGDAQRLRAMKPTQQPGKLHPEIEQYAKALFAARGSIPGAAPGNDDNSNTQFAVIAVWLARKHGVPVDGALDLIEKRYRATQLPRTGGWAYSGGPAGETVGSPSMHCAGLIGLATSVARREERRQKLEAPKKEPPKVDPAMPPAKKSDDPFFNPVPKAGGDGKKPAARPADALDRQVQIGLAGLGLILGESARAGRGALYLGIGPGHGSHDLYFFWSLERVGVIYGIDKIGGVDWHDAGCRTLVQTQKADGSWAGGYTSEIDTSFAVLFLCKSNLARDLSSKVQKEVSTEMRAGAGPTDSSTKGSQPSKEHNPNALIPNPVLPGPTGSEAAALAGDLMRSAEKDWLAVLKKLRDAKGPVYTQALVAAVARLDAERRPAAREALAERLTRMTASSLRTMARDEEPELRRASVLAMAMKDEKAHIPDLINALLDDEDLVIRAAKAGLKSLTGQDFGPRANASTGDKRLAVAAWNEWLGKQKK
jgi:hypothetical protein